MRREPTCPICNADVPMSGEEKAGDEIHCAFCQTPLKVQGSSEEDMDLEEDF